jgi:hypothetical protein
MFSHGDLFRNHPAVERFGCVDSNLNHNEFDQCFVMGGRGRAQINLVEHYATSYDLIDRRRIFRSFGRGNSAVSADASACALRWQSETMNLKDRSVEGASPIDRRPEGDGSDRMKQADSGGGVN